MHGHPPDGSLVPRQSTRETDLKRAEQQRDRVIRACSPEPTENASELLIAIARMSGIRLKVGAALISIVSI
jgi:hypothetical protein